MKMVKKHTGQSKTDQETDAIENSACTDGEKQSKSQKIKL